MMHRARWIYPALVCVMIAAYYVSPGARTVVVALIGTLAAASIVTGALVRRPTRRIAWLLIALGVLIIAAGEVGYDILATGGASDTFPSGPDWFYIFSYPPLAVGLLWLGLARAPSRDWPGIIETSALSLAGTLVVWIALILPTMRSMHVTPLGKVVLVAGWVGYVIILVCGLHLVTAWPRNLSAWLLGLAAVALFLGDLRYSYRILHGTWVSGGLVDGGVLTFFALAGYAAVVPSMSSIGSPRATGHRMTFGGLTMLALALLVAPSLLLAAASPGPVTIPVATVGAAIGLLVIARMWVAIRAHRRTLARTATVRRATRDLGLSVDADDVAASLSRALAELADGTPTSVELVSDRAEQPIEAADDRLPVAVPVDGEDDAASGAVRSIVFHAPPADLAELYDILVNLADQASIALDRVDLTERVRVSEREQHVLAYRASHDGLTGLANAELFRSELRAESRVAEPHRLTAVIFIDLDDFKSINDTLGHETGDAVLVATANRIRAGLRRTDLGARLGGDEFAVLLRDIGDEAAAYGVVRRMTETLAQPTMVGAIPVVCRASVGLAFAAAPDQYDTLLRKADTALYAAKSAGKGRWRPYEPEMRSPLRRGSDLRAELERALRAGPDARPDATNGLTMHYQPIVELATNQTAGFEALIRWEHPERGTIRVPDLIALAENTGLILPLGEWVFARAFTDGDGLTRDHGRYVSVNVSVAQLRLTGFTNRIRRQLAASAIDPRAVVIEITESQLVQDDERIWDDLADLRTSGIRVAIDDYGTGYATLSYLRHPVIDIVKLDRRFLNDIASERSQALLRAALGLSAELGLTLIAEGVEDELTRTTLIDLGCVFGQGHLFAPAMPPEEAGRWNGNGR